MVNQVDKELIERATTSLLRGVNMFNHIHCDGTPERVARMWEGFMDCEEPTYTKCPYDYKVDMIVMRNHLTWGFCPHHLLPVKYSITVGYIPDTEVFGASKPLRIADYVTSRFPLQEDVPGLIYDIFAREIHPRGFGCVVRGEHLCMRMRGVKSSCSDMVTPLLMGEMKESPWREQFLICVDMKAGEM